VMTVMAISAGSPFPWVAGTGLGLLRNGFGDQIVSVCMVASPCRSAILGLSGGSGPLMLAACVDAGRIPWPRFSRHLSMCTSAQNTLHFLWRAWTLPGKLSVAK
jgi:hypothetical protein